MGEFDILQSLLETCAPVLVALVGIIPTIISNRKKTQDSLTGMQDKLAGDIQETKQEISDVKDNFREHVGEFEDVQAKATRYRILRFYDEICEHRKHSESHFEDILDDIDFYERYCASHPEFKNNRGTVAMEHIKEIYRKVKSEGGFLTHE